MYPAHTLKYSRELIKENTGASNLSNINIIRLNEHWLLENQIFSLSSIFNYKVGAFFCTKNEYREGSCIDMGGL